MSCKRKINRIKRLSEELGANMVNFENRAEFLINLVKNSRDDWQLTFLLPPNNKIKKRVVYHPRLGLCEYLPKSRKFIVPLNPSLIENALDVEWVESFDNLEAEEKIEHVVSEQLARYQQVMRAIRKYKHPNLSTPYDEYFSVEFEQRAEQLKNALRNLYNEYLARRQQLQALLEQSNELLVMNNLKQFVLDQYNAQFDWNDQAKRLFFEYFSDLKFPPTNYKMIRLSYFPPYGPNGEKQPWLLDQYREKIKQHIENRQPLDLRWRSWRDISIHLFYDEKGKFMGSLSAEFHDTANGDYYCLLNEDCALFGEGD